MTDLRRAIDHFDSYVKLLELTGADDQRIVGTVRIIIALRNLAKMEPPPLEVLLTDGTLEKTKGIGPSTRKKLQEFVDTGTTADFEAMKGPVPAGLFDVLEVPSLGAKKVRQLWQDLQITSLGELEYACNENRLAMLKGWGETSQRRVLEGIQFLRKSANRFHLHHAHAAALLVNAFVPTIPGVEAAEIAGSYRRRCETCANLDLVVAANPGAIASIFDAIATWDEIAEITERDDDPKAARLSVRLKEGIPLDIDIVERPLWAIRLLTRTGNHEHVAALKDRARQCSLNLTDDGLTEGGAPIVCMDEEDIYTALDLPWIPPELREGRNEIELADAGALPPLIDEGDLRGIFHVHTTASDGTITLEQIARIGIERGYEYIGITDHSVSSLLANGLDTDRLLEQVDDIRAVNKKLEAEGQTFRLLHGTEVDIKGDGVLDFPDDVLAQLDFAVASIHAGFSADSKLMTQRLIKAIENPHVTILGHMTGRLLLSRAGYPVDHEAVLHAAARHGKAIEINANPHRLDIDWRWLARAREIGVPIAINPDAHHLSGFDDTQYGVMVARKGGLTKTDVLNAYSLPDCLHPTVAQKAMRARPTKPVVAPTPAEVATNPQAKSPPPPPRTERASTPVDDVPESPKPAGKSPRAKKATKKTSGTMFDQLASKQTGNAAPAPSEPMLTKRASSAPKKAPAQRAKTSAKTTATKAASATKKATTKKSATKKKATKAKVSTTTKSKPKAAKKKAAPARSKQANSKPRAKTATKKASATKPSATKPAAAKPATAKKKTTPQRKAPTKSKGKAKPTAAKTARATTAAKAKSKTNSTAKRKTKKAGAKTRSLF